MQRYEVGRKLKDTLMGEARQGVGYFLSPHTGQLQSIDVLLKSFNKQCVLNGTTLAGQHIQEDPRTELMIQTKLSSPASYHASLLSSPSYLDRIAVQSSSHIIKLYDVKDEGETIVAVMEFAHGGELYTLLHNSGPAFTQAHAQSYFVQLLLAVSAIHTLDIIHRDISLENLLLTKESSLRVCDFGLAREITRGQRLEERSACGKLRYMSPEVFSCIQFDGVLSDVWSVGVCLFVMLVKVFPWNIPHSSDPLFVMICSGRLNDVMKGWGKQLLSDGLCDLFAHIFCPEERRHSIAQLLESDWLKDVWHGPRERDGASMSSGVRDGRRGPLSAPASLGGSGESSAASSPPNRAALRGDTGSASPLSLTTASTDELSAGSSTGPRSPPIAAGMAASSSPLTSISSAQIVTRSMSPTAALSSADYASAMHFARQQQSTFTLQEVGASRALTDSTPSSPPAPAHPHNNGHATTNGHAQLDIQPSISSYLYPTAVDVAAVDKSAMPAGPSLEHSCSRRDRL